MKKSTKGALAAAASASLLLGGAGSLAYWNTTDTVNPGSFTTGNLVLVADACESNTDTWTLTNAVEGTSNLLDATEFAALRIVPGDVLTKRCDVAITATGDNLRANLGITNGVDTVTAGSDGLGPLTAADYTVVPTYQVDGVTRTSITDDDNGKFMNVTLTVTFPLLATTETNRSKIDTVQLGGLTVTAVQAGATP